MELLKDRLPAQGGQQVFLFSEIRNQSVVHVQDTLHSEPKVLFYPNTDTESLSNQKLYYHRLGTGQEEDVLCVEFPAQPKHMIGWVDLSECGRYLFVKPSQDCKYNLLPPLLL